MSCWYREGCTHDWNHGLGRYDLTSNVSVQWGCSSSVTVVLTELVLLRFQQSGLSLFCSSARALASMVYILLSSLFIFFHLSPRMTLMALVCGEYWDRRTGQGLAFFRWVSVTLFVFYCSYGVTWSSLMGSQRHSLCVKVQSFIYNVMDTKHVSQFLNWLSTPVPSFPNSTSAS